MRLPDLACSRRRALAVGAPRLMPDVRPTERQQLWLVQEEPMPESLPVGRLRPTRGALVRGSASWGSLLACLALVSVASVASGQQLPAGGTTSWEIRAPEEIVTFVLFDPKARGISLPAGLRFVSARDAQVPGIQEYLRQHPDHAGWAFSFIEITRQKAFLIDGKGPALPKNGGIGLWFAPVDPSQLATEIPKGKFDTIIGPALGAVLGLGIWIPDREYVAYMRARGHHAEYGMVTLVKDGAGAFRGEIRLNDLHVRGSALPHGEIREDPASGTQVLFAPGKKVVHAVVIAGTNARHLACTAEWSKSGSHPLARGVFVGPTYFTTYEAPLKGSAYPLRDGKER